MKYVYPAIFESENGKYYVSVPDLSGCNTVGDDLQDAIEMARDAIEMWLCIAEDRKEKIPKPTENLKSEKSFISLIDADTTKYRKMTSNRAVKKTLTIPSWLNEQAELAGVNFSQILQEALVERLNIQ
ncbi:MAG: type II toxin-antitoxin system HicB family antitoxin [Ruminococcus sp.]|nr:type II toxin-antitoxin system HicB family antitoxin [Ruminococcus sp.]